MSGRSCTCLASVPVLVCAMLVLPMTFGAVSSRDSEDVEDSELLTLLKQLRGKLRGLEKTEGMNYRSIHDDVNEEHSAEEAMLAKLRRSNTRAMCPSQLPGSTLTPDQQDQLVNEMNSKRKSAGAADMYKLHWDSKLASLAQDWADKCNFAHGSCSFDSTTIGFSTVGQNLWAYEGPFDASRIVQNWYGDKENFDPVTQTCAFGQPCGGYRQLVTGYTTRVGCAVTKCGSMGTIAKANFVVCFFAPPGNNKDANTFTPGPSCTLCKNGQFFCNDGLCDDTCTATGSSCTCAASCQQCGSVTSDCRCKCNAGSSGVSCEKPCEDHDKRCGKKAGWPKNFCDNANFKGFVLEACPRMCNECEVGSPCNNGAAGAGNPAPNGGAGGTDSGAGNGGNSGNSGNSGNAGNAGNAGEGGNSDGEYQYFD